MKTATMTPPAVDADGQAWIDNAEAIADHQMTWHAVRRDVFGIYTEDRGPETAHAALTRDVCLANARGERVIWFHSISTDGKCKTAALDIDAHDDGADRDKNLRCALRAAELFRDLGLDALIFDSNGKGGYHVRVYFKKPILAEVAYWLCQRVIAILKGEGFGTVEGFPKQPAVTLACPYGNGIRGPGKHHRRNHWARAYDFKEERFVGGRETVAIVLGIAGSPTKKLLEAYQAEQPKAEAGSNGTGHKKGLHASSRKSYPPPPEAELRDALSHLSNQWRKEYGGTRDNPAWLGVGMALHDWDSTQRGLDLWHEFSKGSTNYDQAALDAKWETFTQGGGLTVKTIFGEAIDRGWTPAEKTDKAKDKTSAPEPFETDGDPHRLARGIHKEMSNRDGAPLLVRYQDEDMRYEAGCFRVDTTFAKVDMIRLMKSDLDRRNVAALAQYEKRKAEAEAATEKFRERTPAVVPVTRRLIADVSTVLGSLVSVDRHGTPPFWISPKPGDPAPKDVISARNGLIDLGRDDPQLRAHTPRLFTTCALPYGFDPDAAEPTLWLEFLAEQWAKDQESIDTLHEILGYLLTPDARFHKIFLLIGPPRSGRSTIRKVLTELIGPSNVAATSVASLAGEFGLQALLGKSVAVMGDTRTGEAHDSAVMMDRLLRISGGDPIEVNRKNKPLLPCVEFSTRLVIISNELPNFRDAAGAIVSRYLILKTTHTIPAEERDSDLADKIIASELPGILNLAIQARARLYERGRFVQPASGEDLLNDAGEIASPVAACVRERFTINPNADILATRAFAIWQEWAITNGYQPGNAGTFGKNLKASFPGITKTRPRADDGKAQVCTYKGIEEKFEY
jgi:P4 family phage/plasmid primase-like protien